MRCIVRRDPPGLSVEGVGVLVRCGFVPRLWCRLLGSPWISCKWYGRGIDGASGTWCGVSPSENGPPKPGSDG